MIRSNNKGLTLIEVLTVIVISGILLTMVSVLFYSFTTMYQQLDHQNKITNDIVLIKSSISKYVNKYDDAATKITITSVEGVSKLNVNENEFQLYLSEDGSFMVNDVRIVNKTAISKITFTTNATGSILKCKIDYKTSYNRDDIQSQEFIKVVRCAKIEVN